MPLGAPIRRENSVSNGAIQLEFYPDGDPPDRDAIFAPISIDVRAEYPGIRDNPRLHPLVALQPGYYRDTVDAFEFFYVTSEVTHSPELTSANASLINVGGGGRGCGGGDCTERERDVALIQWEGNTEAEYSNVVMRERDDNGNATLHVVAESLFLGEPDERACYTVQTLSWEGVLGSEVDAGCI